MRELQSLCLDIAVHKLETQEDGTSRDSEVDLMADVGNRRTPSRPTYESITSREEPTGNTGAAGATSTVTPEGIIAGQGQRVLLLRLLAQRLFPLRPLRLALAGIAGAAGGAGTATEPAATEKTELL